MSILTLSSEAQREFIRMKVILDILDKLSWLEKKLPLSRLRYTLKCHTTTFTTKSLFLLTCNISHFFMIYSANVQYYVIHSLTPPYHAYILI